MKATKQEMKQEAIKMLKALDIYKPYIKAFEAEDQEVCMFEGYGGFYTHQFPELAAKIKKFEEHYNCMVYAVTHEITEFGELYDFLYVSENKSEWEEPYKENGISYLFAYVWNVDDDFCSEFGSIGVKSFGGGIARKY